MIACFFEVSIGLDQFVPGFGGLLVLVVLIWLGFGGLWDMRLFVAWLVRIGARGSGVLSWPWFVLAPVSCWSVLGMFQGIGCFIGLPCGIGRVNDCWYSG
jgi:hypothetical protein